MKVDQEQDDEDKQDTSDQQLVRLHHLQGDVDKEVISVLNNANTSPDSISRPIKPTGI